MTYIMGDVRLVDGFASHDPGHMLNDSWRKSNLAKYHVFQSLRTDYLRECLKEARPLIRKLVGGSIAEKYDLGLNFKPLYL